MRCCCIADNLEGTASLEDCLFVTDAWLATPGNQDILTRFLRASFRGMCSRSLL